MFKILVIFHRTPDVRSYTTILFENLLPLLREKIEVRLAWFVYGPVKQATINSQDRSSSILYIQDYENAAKVIRQEKPDIIYCHPAYSPVEYAFSVASKHFEIPLIAGEFAEDLYRKSGRLVTLRLLIKQFFQSSLPGETSDAQGQFMKRGRHYIQKYFFFLRTLKDLGISKTDMIRNILADVKLYSLLGSSEMSPLDASKVFSRYSGDINFVESQRTKERLLKQGFRKSSIVVVGNPTYDTLLQKFENFYPSPKKDNKIRVLIITKNPNDPGGHWAKKSQDSWLREVATEFSKHKDEMSLVIKIHPTGEILSEYESIIKSIEPSISIYQHGDIVEFLRESDIVVGTSTSTALVCSLIAKRPIIIWNVYGVDNDVFLVRKLALECKDNTSFIRSIYSALESNPASQDKIEEFIRDYLYKADGRATERIRDVILDQVKNLRKMKDNF